MRLCDRIFSESVPGTGLKLGLFHKVWIGLMLDQVGFHSNHFNWDLGQESGISNSPIAQITIPCYQASLL